MNIDEAKTLLRGAVERATSKYEHSASGTEVEAGAVVLRALDEAEARAASAEFRAAAAEAGQRAYGEVLLALAPGGPPPAAEWGPVALALWEASLSASSDDYAAAVAVCVAMDAAEAELAKETP